MGTEIELSSDDMALLRRAVVDCGPQLPGAWGWTINAFDSDDPDETGELWTFDDLLHLLRAINQEKSYLIVHRLDSDDHYTQAASRSGLFITECAIPVGNRTMNLAFQRNASDLPLREAFDVMASYIATGGALPELDGLNTVRNFYERDSASTRHSKSGGLGSLWQWLKS